MAKFLTTKQQSCGIALGGIGTGSVELFPDGEFHQWQIYNTDRWATCCREAKVDDGEVHTGDLAFWVRTEEENGNVIVRKLGMNTAPDDFTYRMYTWNKPVEKIEFNGRFPLCELDYHDSALPCNIRLSALSPFVPHDSDTSASPGFYLNFKLQNSTDKPIKVSLLGRSIGSFMNSDAQRQSRIVTEHDCVYLTSEPLSDNNASNCGSIALSVRGAGETSCIVADYQRFLREYVSNSEFGISQESFLFGFRESGQLPDDTAIISPVCAPDPNDRLASEALAACSDEEIEQRFERIAALSSARALIKRIQRTIPFFPSNRAKKEAFLRCYYRQMELMHCEAPNAFGAGALCHTLTLPAHSMTEVRFVYSWYFPHHYSAYGQEMGHYYERFFDDALAVNRYLVDGFDRISGTAESFANLLFDTSLPDVYPEAWSAHLSTLVKCSWYLKDGRFGIWEGLGYCGFHTTDITYHASFGLLALFPNLQLCQMEMGAAFQREDGRVHHFFTPDLYHTDWGFDRVDMNPQFVLMVCRDYLFTGNEGYLARMWHPVVKAIESIALLDLNGDGLPDTNTGRNTYDAWHLEGTPCYISILWLAALKAGIHLAERMGDSKTMNRWSKTLRKGKHALEKLLWNGEYYDLWRSEEKTDSCLMTDQLDGEWFLRMIGLEGNLSNKRIKQVLSNIWKHNFNRETGLVNASCPPDRETTLFTYQNCQAEAQWTGIGYAVAALLLTVGQKAEAHEIVETIHGAQARFGHYWDHWECGYRYSRPLSSWSMLHAALGLGIDRGARMLTLKPAFKASKNNAFKAPLCTPDGIGQVVYSIDRLTLTCTEGQFSIQTLILPIGDWTTVELNGETVAATICKEKCSVRIDFEYALTVDQAHSLHIRSLD